MKQLSYNKAALIATCIADAEKERGPTPRPCRSEQNLVVTTCVDIKLKQMQKFSDLAAYADFFFPERIASCGESSRLPERERCCGRMSSCSWANRSFSTSRATTNV